MFCKEILKLKQVLVSFCGLFPPPHLLLPLKCYTKMHKSKAQGTCLHMWPLLSTVTLKVRGQRKIDQAVPMGQKNGELLQLPQEGNKMSRLSYFGVSALNKSLGLDHWFPVWTHNWII